MCSIEGSNVTNCNSDFFFFFLALYFVSIKTVSSIQINTNLYTSIQTKHYIKRALPKLYHWKALTSSLLPTPFANTVLKICPHVTRNISLGGVLNVWRRQKAKSTFLVLLHQQSFTSFRHLFLLRFPIPIPQTFSRI